MINVKRVESKSILINCDGLDPITVYYEDYGKTAGTQGNSGRLTFLCYGDAWSVYWPAMGDMTIIEFFIFASKDPSYILSKVMPQHIDYPMHHKKYIERIIKAVANGLKKFIAEEGKPNRYRAGKF